MTLDSDQVRTAFATYVKDYDDTNPKIKLKIVHTYHVADIAERIAKSLSLSNEDIDFAWLSGMLHDIGRFEQLRQFDTFNDFVSIDHAEFGADILFEGDKIITRFAGLSSTETKLLEKAIRLHNKYRLPEDLDERTLMFSNILRDADKVDILRVNIDTPLSEIYSVPESEVLNSTISPMVLDTALHKTEVVQRKYSKTPLDHLIGHSCLVFELVYPESYKIVKENDYINKLLSFKATDKVVNQEIKEIRDRINQYIDAKIA